MGFFGLTPSDKPYIHKSIFNLVYYGKGFNFAEVYDMPVYLRNWYLNQLNSTLKKEADEIKKQSKKGRVPTPRR